MNARARENEDYIVYGPTHSRPNRPRSYLGIDLIVSCSLSLSLSRAGRWNRENCHCHGRPSTMTTSAKREAKKKTLRSPCLRPSVADRDAKAEKDRARARTHERTDGRREGGREGGTRRSRTSCTAAPRYSARNAGGAHRGRGRGPETTTGSLHREYVRERASTSPGGATRAWGRAASPTSPSNRTRELVQQRLCVRPRPCVRPLVHSRMQVIRANGGRRRQRRSKKKKRRRTDNLEVATGGTPRHSLAPRLTTTSAAAHAPQRGDAIAIVVVVAGHRWW